MRSDHHAIIMGLAICLVATMLLPGVSPAQSFSRLQVLLPGEEPAPETTAGKIGVPAAQAVGIPFAVRVRACDSAWHTVPDVSDIVRLSSTDAGATLPADAMLASGEATLTVVLNAAGTFTISAVDVSDPTIPEAASAPVTAMVLQGFAFSEIHQKNQYAGLPMSLEVRAVDPAGQTVTGYSGAVQLQELTSYGPGRIEPQTITVTGGVWSGMVTCYRADETSINRGNVNIKAFLEVQPDKHGISDPFTVHPGTLARVQIVVPGQDPAPGSVSGVTGAPATQGAAQPFTIDVYATDTWWNPLPSAHTVRVVSDDPAGSSPVSGILSEGHAQLTLSLMTVGDRTLTVTDQTDGSIPGMTSAPIPVIASTVHHFEFDSLPVSVQAGEPVTVIVRATDAGGNTLPAYSGDAHLSANTGPGSISPEHVTFASGIWSGEMVFRGAGGAVSLSCADYASPPHIGTSDPFQVLSGQYSRLQIVCPGQQPQGGTSTGVSGLPDDQAAGVPFQVLIRAVDDYFNRVNAATPQILLQSSDVNLTKPAGIQLAGGETSVSVTLYCAGLQTLTAQDADSADIAAGTSSEIDVVPGPYARLLLLAPGEEVSPGAQDGRSGAATDQSISFAFTVKVLATDAWWNSVGGVSHTVRLTSTDPLAELPPDTPLIDGRADLVVRLSTGGFQQLTASNMTDPSVPGSTTQVRAISSGLHLEASIEPTEVQAGAPFSLTVRAVNDAGSVIQEINSFVEVEVRNASSQEPGAGTLLNTRFQLLQGQRVVQQTYTRAEPIVLMVTDDAGNAPAITDVLEVRPGAPATLLLQARPEWLRGERHAAITAAVQDAYENGVPDRQVDFTLVLGSGTLTVEQDSTGSDGVALADYLSGRQQEMARITAASGVLAAVVDIETAFVDPAASGGTLTSYPNPFHPDEAPTTIAYVLDTDARVHLRLFTLSGGLVLDREFDPGSEYGHAGLNEFRWDGLNGQNDPVASGGYILLVEAEAGGTTLHTMRRKIGVVR